MSEYRLPQRMIHLAKTHVCPNCGFEFECSPHDKAPNLNVDHVDAARCLSATVGMTSRNAFLVCRDRAIENHEKIQTMNGVRARLSELKKYYGYVRMEIPADRIPQWYLTDEGQTWLRSLDNKDNYQAPF